MGDDGLDRRQFLRLAAATLTINTPATIEAAKVCAEIYRTGMTDEVFAWDASSNNRLLAPGRGSLILNAISALRTAEQQDPELAKQFLVDLTLASRDAFVHSSFYNLPAFPGAVPDLDDLVATDPAPRPANKYALLADATSWSTNLGNPGFLNAAVDEVINLFLLSNKFSVAARGEKSPAEAVADAEAEMRPIFEKWRERGKI